MPAEHHKLLLAELTRIERGELDRLAIFLPPGSAKSTYGSVLFPAHYLANHPDRCVIAASHTAELAERFGRRVRNLISEHGEVLGVKLASDSQSAGRWSTSAGGEYFAAGVGGSITGRRADLALIDDPVRSREDADSQTIRDRQWEWYRFDLMTRLKPGAAIVLIQTRWHEDDLAGRILQEEGDRWKVIRIPMEAEEDDPLGRKPGERLWADYFTADQVESAKRDPRVWSALYQQTPTPDTGALFKREWLLPYQPKDLPTNLNIYVGSDHAVSESESADYTCCIPVGVCDKGIVWVLPDVWWERAPSNEFVRASLDIVRRRGPIIWGAEKGHISKSIGPFWKDALLQAGLHLNIEEITVTRDKRTRAQSICGRMAMGMVRFPVFAPWWPRAQAELLSFPAGKHDDFVDALAHVGFLLDKMANAMPRRGPTLGEMWEEVNAIGGSNLPGASC